MTEAFEQECVAFFEEAVQVFGVPKSIGQIYGILYASREPLSFSDIVDRLKISKGSASQGLALLRSLGAINVAGADAQVSGGSTPSSSRVTYEPELSLRRLVSGVLRERIAPMAANGADRLKRLGDLANQVSEDDDFYVDRVKQLNTWRRRLKTVLPVLTTLLGPKR